MHESMIIKYEPASKPEHTSMRRLFLNPEAQPAAATFGGQGKLESSFDREDYPVQPSHKVKVDIRLPAKGNSKVHGARPVH